MGASPGDQLEVLIILGTLMILSVLLAVVFATLNWRRNHPGEITRRFRGLIRLVSDKITGWFDHIVLVERPGNHLGTD